MDERKTEKQNERTPENYKEGSAGRAKHEERQADSTNERTHERTTHSHDVNNEWERKKHKEKRSK